MENGSNSRLVQLISCAASLSDDDRRTAHRLCALGALALAVYAFAVGGSSTMEPHKVWALFAFLGYAGCAVLLLFGQSIKGAVAVLFGLSVVVPFAALIARDLAQHEVTIVGDGASRLLATGSPYVSDPSGVNEVFPYFPLMAVFGIPRAVFGEHFVTDPRMCFAAFFGAVTWLTLRRLVRPATARLVLVLLAVSPLVAIPLATGGVDLPVVALAGLAAVTMWTREYRLNAFVVALGCAIKFTFWPLAVMMVLIQVRSGRGVRCLQWVRDVVAVVALTIVPSAIVDWSGFVAGALRFPLGLSGIESPAGRGLLGGPLSDRGLLGTAAIVGILVVSAAAISWTTLRKPTLSAANILLLAAVGYTVLFLVAPVSRAGYFVLPFVLAVLGVVSYLSEAARLTRARTTEPASRPIADAL